MNKFFSHTPLPACEEAYGDLASLFPSVFSPENVHLIFEGLGLLRQAGQLFVTLLQLHHLTLQYLSPHTHVISAVLQSNTHMTQKQKFVSLRKLNGLIIRQQMEQN